MIHSQKIGKQKETYAGFAPIIKISTKTITTMKKSFMFMTSLFAVATLISSCTKDVEPEADNAAATIVTRAAGDTPAPTAYIEVNDTNPLNVLMYRNADNTPFFKITKVFAANINDNGSEPCLYLNDNVTDVLVPSAGSTTTGHYKYVQPIRQDGGKVLLSILGNHKGVGVGNLTEANQEKFAEILAWAVEEYQLDGIDFDDEWSKYGENSNFPSSVSGSFSGLVLKLREKLDARFPNEHKLITVFYIGYASSLSSAAVAACDYGWYAYFGPNVYVSPSSPWTNAKWSAQAINLNQSYNAITLNQIKNRSAQSKTDGMGAIMTYDLRVQTNRDPLAAIQKIGEGIGLTVSRASSPASGYAKDWSTGGPGTTITYADVQ